MIWNYRIILHDDDEQPWFGLHEVYYDEGRISGWTENPVSFVCDMDEGTVGIIGSLRRALASALKSKPLVESELEVE